MKSILFLVFLILVQNIFAQSRFVRDDNIVYDKELHLLWQDNIEVSDTKLSLDNSMKYCENLKLSTYINWRLPTYEELLSIGDYEVYKPTLNPIFNNSASGHFWSIIYKRIAYKKEWVPQNDYFVKRIYFSDGYSYDNDRTGKAYVRCVKEDNKSIN